MGRDVPSKTGPPWGDGFCCCHSRPKPVFDGAHAKKKRATLAIDEDPHLAGENQRS